MSNRKANILIVEDEVGSRDSLRMVLRPFNNVCSAETGQTALDMLEEQLFDIVTLDLKLPGIHGVDLLREIKRRQPYVEIVIITGYGNLKSAMDAIRYGAADYLLKPFNVVALLDAINKALERKRRLDMLRDFVSNMEILKKPMENQQDHYMHFVKVLSNTLDSKDRYTHRHCVRVNIYANLIADQLNIPEEKRSSLELGAFLHDIGKIGVDSKIIFKDQKLTEQEVEAVQKHPEIGTDIVAPLQLPMDVVSMIRHHHERFDGTGYPDGLRGEQIPLLTRVISLAESMDAMAADRPYRRAVPLEKVIVELKRCSGTQWDSVLVDALLTVIAERGKDILPQAIDPKGKMVTA